MAMTLSDPPVPADWARQTPASDPGPWASPLAAVPPRPAEIGQVVRNLVAHYRGQEAELPAATRGDVDLRWVADMLATDHRRHGGRPLDAERAVGERLQGCCRDHSLLAVAILRHHHVPARCRVGFANYFVPAGEAFRLLRQGKLDPSTYGVAPEIPELSGETFVLPEILWELAHRYGDELLLWDSWGGVPGPGEQMDPALLTVLDRAAELLAAADSGSARAEQELHALYRSDPRLHPGTEVVRHSPVGEGLVTVRLR